MAGRRLTDMTSRNRGLFITLEGGEGTGKTTQIEALSATLQDKGHDVVLTREPGGTPEAEKLRDLLVQRDGGDWTPMAEVLLLFAARQMHITTLIQPALDAGKIVICDRFTDSTRAYQSYGHGLPLEQIDRVNDVAIDGFAPDITIILDMPVEKGLARAGKRLADDDSSEDRYERLDISFHEKLRQGFLQIAQKEPQRCHVIDAERPVDNIAKDIEALVLSRVNAL